MSLPRLRPRGLPADVRDALDKVAVAEGISPAEALRRAALAYRDDTTVGPYAQIWMPLGPDIEAAVLGHGCLSVIGRGAELLIRPAGDVPTADEVDAMERLAEAVLEARDGLRAAYRAAQ